MPRSPPEKMLRPRGCSEQYEEQAGRSSDLTTAQRPCSRKQAQERAGRRAQSNRSVRLHAHFTGEPGLEQRIVEDPPGERRRANRQGQQRRATGY